MGTDGGDDALRRAGKCGSNEQSCAMSLLPQFIKNEVKKSINLKPKNNQVTEKLAEECTGVPAVCRGFRKAGLPGRAEREKNDRLLFGRI